MKIIVDDNMIPILLNEGCLVKYEDEYILNTVMFVKKKTKKTQKAKEYHISFDSEIGKFNGITSDDKFKWTELWPMADIELRKMEVWLKANKNKRYKDYESFIVGWLNRSVKQYGNQLINVPNHTPEDF